MNDVSLISKCSSSAVCRAVCELYQNNTALRPDLTVNSMGKRQLRPERDAASKVSLKRPTGWLRHQDEKEKWHQMTSILAEWQMRKKAGLRRSIYYYSRKQRIQEFPSVISQTMKKVPILTTHSLTNGPQHDSSNGHSKLRELPMIQHHSLVI